jgi:AMMECR1 domain-containing protein
MKNRFLLRACGLGLALLLNSSGHVWAAKHSALTQRATLSLPALVQQTMAFHFENGPHQAGLGSYHEFIQQLPPIKSPYRQPAGVFVTLSRDGKPRACWGSAFPQYKTVAESTVYSTLGALTKEYRYKPISPSEWRLLKPQVTVIKALEPIHGLQGQNPLRDGLMVRQAGRTGVILPGEARDSTYQLTLCKLKAGIQPGQTFQLYRMIADVYH